MITNIRSKLARNKSSYLDGLYHEYSFFGKNNVQAEGHFILNQHAKSPIITAYIALAIAKTKEIKKDISFIELFCADAYYAMVASRLGATKVAGADNNKDGYADAEMADRIAKELDVSNFTFVDTDINNLGKKKYDIVANVGGLYHITNPEAVLEKSYEMARHFLIIQTVVSLANKKKDYFETPAPGWDWGSRYNPQSFDRMIKSKGYEIIDQHFNELKGNGRLEDRGSAYYLIQK